MAQLTTAHPASAGIPVGGRLLPRRTATAALRLVVHELRAHVTVLSGYADLLRDPDLRNDPARRELVLGRIGDQVDRLREMSDHLAGVVRTGEGQARLEPVDLAAAGRQALIEVERVARLRGCSLILVEPAAAERVVLGDHFQLTTAMRNLLENACRHGPSGGLVILHLDVTGNGVRVAVHDQGEGLTPLGGAAFAPLVRGDDAAPGGMGLGLSLVREVARQHGGRAVWGGDPDGSWVGLEFPLRRAA